MLELVPTWQHAHWVSSGDIFLGENIKQRLCLGDGVAGEPLKPGLNQGSVGACLLWHPIGVMGVAKPLVAILIANVLGLAQGTSPSRPLSAGFGNTDPVPPALGVDPGDGAKRLALFWDWGWWNGGPCRDSLPHSCRWTGCPRSSGRHRHRRVGRHQHRSTRSPRDGAQTVSPNCPDLVNSLPTR